MQAYLIRIGIDQAYGAWNAPVDPRSNEFVYVPIPESRPMRQDMMITYRDVVPSLEAFRLRHGLEAGPMTNLPTQLRTAQMHLDPDFERLTYGDSGIKRGKGLTQLDAGDLLVFYSGLRPIASSPHRLIYALTGFYRVAEVLRAGQVRHEDWAINAHTRCLNTEPSDVIVTGQPGVSGRLKRCIPIGEFRDLAYRVKSAVLEDWGGLSCKNGYLQRSAVLPRLLHPQKFLRWFEGQSSELIAANNG